MKSILLLTCLISTSIASKCHSCFVGVCYQRSKLFNGPISGQLAIDRTQNILYFHSSNQSFENTGAYYLNDAMLAVLPGVTFTFARAVDQSNGDVYMSSTKGIYKYKPSTNTTVLYALGDKTIWRLQYTDKLYYSIYSETGLYTLENKRTAAITALSNYKIDDFAIDQLGDIYFSSNMTLYKLKKDAKSAVKFGDEVNTLTTDRYGNLFFTQTATSGVYKLDYSSDKILNVGAFGRGTPLKFVFDNSNSVVYYDSDNRALYYLLPTYGRCMVTKKGGKTKGYRVRTTNHAADEAKNLYANSLN